MQPAVYPAHLTKNIYIINQSINFTLTGFSNMQLSCCFFLLFFFGHVGAGKQTQLSLYVLALFWLLQTLGGNIRLCSRNMFAGYMSVNHWLDLILFNSWLLQLDTAVKQNQRAGRRDTVKTKMLLLIWVTTATTFIRHISIFNTKLFVSAPSFGVWGVKCPKTNILWWI